jgi:hypothetical protein
MIVCVTIVGGKHPLKLFTTKIVEVPASLTPKPYKYHQIDPQTISSAAGSGAVHRHAYYELGVNV